MVGGLVMAGLMGGLALLLANLSKQQNYIQKSTETHFEANALFDAIVRTLYDGEACKNTLGDGAPVSAGRDIDEIRNRDNGVVFNKTDKYGNRLLRVESMTLRDDQLSGTSGTVNLEVVLLKTSSVLKGYKKVVRELPITVEVAAGGNNLVSCHHSIDNLDPKINSSMNNQVTQLIDAKLDDVIQELCTAFGGAYSNSRCIPP